MTIHKAKGLEFKIVIIPFCNWSLDHEPWQNSNILWCKTKENPLISFPFVPVNYSSSLNHTMFSDEYQKERMLSYVDNLNLLYVAFTRAKRRTLCFLFAAEGSGEHFRD